LFQWISVISERCSLIIVICTNDIDRRREEEATVGTGTRSGLHDWTLWEGGNYTLAHTHTCTHTHKQPFYGPLGFCPGLPGWAGTRKVKPGRYALCQHSTESIKSTYLLVWHCRHTAAVHCYQYLAAAYKLDIFLAFVMTFAVTD